jgi:hypothetical protein
MAPISYRGKFSGLSSRLVVTIRTVHLRDFEGGLRIRPRAKPVEIASVNLRLHLRRASRAMLRAHRLLWHRRFIAESYGSYPFPQSRPKERRSALPPFLIWRSSPACSRCSTPGIHAMHQGILHRDTDRPQDITSRIHVLDGRTFFRFFDFTRR